jgi:hypothetical protein
VHRLLLKTFIRNAKRGSFMTLLLVYAVIVVTAARVVFLELGSLRIVTAICTPGSVDSLIASEVGPFLS